MKRKCSPSNPEREASKRKGGFDFDDNNVYYRNTYKPSITDTPGLRESTEFAASTTAKPQFY